MQHVFYKRNLWFHVHQRKMNIASTLLILLLWQAVLVQLEYSNANTFSKSASLTSGATTAKKDQKIINVVKDRLINPPIPAKLANKNQHKNEYKFPDYPLYSDGFIIVDGVDDTDVDRWSDSGYWQGKYGCSSDMLVWPVGAADKVGIPPPKRFGKGGRGGKGLPSGYHDDHLFNDNRNNPGTLGNGHGHPDDNWGHHYDDSDDAYDEDASNNNIGPDGSPLHRNINPPHPFSIPVLNRKGPIGDKLPSFITFTPEQAIHFNSWGKPTKDIPASFVPSLTGSSFFLITNTKGCKSFLLLSATLYYYPAVTLWKRSKNSEQWDKVDSKHSSLVLFYMLKASEDYLVEVGRPKALDSKGFPSLKTGHYYLHITDYSMNMWDIAKEKSWSFSHWNSIDGNVKGAIEIRPNFTIIENGEDFHHAVGTHDTRLTPMFDPKTRAITFYYGRGIEDECPDDVANKVIFRVTEGKDDSCKMELLQNNSYGIECHSPVFHEFIEAIIHTIPE